VAAQHEGSNVFDADLEFLRDKGAEAGAIEHTGHADDAVAREAAELKGGLCHGVQRVGDYDENRIGRVFDDVTDHILHNFVVGVQQVVAAHARFARNTGRNHDDIGVRGIRIVIGAYNEGVASFDRHRLEQVQSLALRDAFDDIDQNHIGQLCGCNPMSRSGPHVASAYDSYFLAHAASFPLSPWGEI
jgi:hypothetical protein